MATASLDELAELLGISKQAIGDLRRTGDVIVRLEAGKYDALETCKPYIAHQRRQAEVFTYVQPILTHITGFSEGAVSPILLVFGAALSIGNVAGGWLADCGVSRALLVTLAVLAW